MTLILLRVTWVGVMQGGRNKIRRAAAIDGDMKRKLLQQDEEDDKLDDCGSELERGP